MKSDHPLTLALVSLAALLTGCASSELAVDTSSVAVYQKRPSCDYTSLGPVSGEDGRLPMQDANNYVRNATAKPASDELALQRMKLAAMELGAEGVIIVRRDETQVPAGGGARGASRSPASQISYRGIAITDCRS